MMLRSDAVNVCSGSRFLWKGKSNGKKNEKIS